MMSRRHEPLTAGLERGPGGWAAVWCFEMPGCYALVPPGADPRPITESAILEYMTWSHFRSAQQLTVADAEFTIVETADCDSVLPRGQTSAFFAHDAESASPREFPLWANPHDAAADELKTLFTAIPGHVLEGKPGGGERTLLDILLHAAATQRTYAAQLHPGGVVQPKPGLDGALRELRDAHALLQQVVCDVQPRLRVRNPGLAGSGEEEWSVRKVMRRSVWHLRYSAWELRREIARFWIP